MIISWLSGQLSVIIVGAGYFVYTEGGIICRRVLAVSNNFF